MNTSTIHEPTQPAPVAHRKLLRGKIREAKLQIDQWWKINGGIVIRQKHEGIRRVAVFHVDQAAKPRQFSLFIQGEPVPVTAATHRRVREAHWEAIKERNIRAKEPIR